MSWEYFESIVACPCGKGTYTETFGSNDWGQTSISWDMDCPLCKANYALYTYSYYKNGMRSKGNRWIEKSKYDKAIKMLNEAKNIKLRAINTAKNKYLDALVTQFENSSKKAIWETLRTNINWYKSLGTFYQHTKGKEKREYLGELFSDYYLNELFKIMQVNDKEIQEQIEKANIVEVEADTLLRGD